MHVIQLKMLDMESQPSYNLYFSATDVYHLLHEVPLHATHTSHENYLSEYVQVGYFAIRCKKTIVNPLEDILYKYIYIPAHTVK